MSKVRITLASTVAIASLIAGGAAAAHNSASRPEHHLAGPVACCEDEGAVGV